MHSLCFFSSLSLVFTCFFFPSALVPPMTALAQAKGFFARPTAQPAWLASDGLACSCFAFSLSLGGLVTWSIPTFWPACLTEHRQLSDNIYPTPVDGSSFGLSSMLHGSDQFFLQNVVVCIILYAQARKHIIHQSWPFDFKSIYRILNRPSPVSSNLIPVDESPQNPRRHPSPHHPPLGLHQTKIHADLVH